MNIYKVVATLLIFPFVLFSHQSVAETFLEAMADGKVNINLRLRYEAVEQDNALKDADALTLRTQLTYTTGKYNGFSGLIEMEDRRVVFGIDDYAVPPSGFNTGEFSVIADPKGTELDQAFAQYDHAGFQARLGRQVITHDGHRFVGHVGWRQDRQTFDALTLKYSPDEDIKLSYNYLDQRNRIFAEDADLDSNDHLVNASVSTRYGKWVGYAYLLELDNGTSNSLDTYGLSFTGSTKSKDFKFTYSLEYATQDSETAVDFDADYWKAEAGVLIDGITLNLVYEVLGSDSGAYGFSTPLATLHKFNGWADVFLATPAQGLEDIALSISGKFSGGKWLAVYHDYDADDATPGIDNFGRELNVQFVRPFGKHLTVGIKYADYNAGDVATGKVDTEKFWLWTQLKF